MSKASQQPCARGKWSAEDIRSSLLLYAVTDPALVSERGLYESARQVLEGGVTFLQLRDKEAAESVLIEQARMLIPLCREFNVPFVINDSLQAVLACDCDGIHIGQDDVPCAEVRAALGPDKIIGVSADTVELALKAERDGADYLGVGAMTLTPTKPESGCISHAEFKAISEAVSIPVVMIGGVNQTTLPHFGGLGADGTAIVSALFGADDPHSAACELRVLCDELFSEEG